jgi:uncharacterized membrane protein YhaH (DUF805 family)
MEGLIILLVVVIICALAPRYGVDSRRFGERDRRGWWPGSARQR